MSQHMDALARANTIRTDRSLLKRRVRAGEVTVAEVLSEIPREAETMTISMLLTSQHRWGRQRARLFLRPLHISDLRPLNELTARERAVIAAQIAHPWNPRWAA